MEKKGTLGCPYSIRDYTDVDPALGDIEDFRQLVKEADARGLRVMLDVVYNHTSHDSILVDNFLWCVQ